MTAKQVILQRLREATDEVHYGEYVGRDGDLVTGVIQAHESRSEKGIVSVDLGKLEAMLPAAEQVPGEAYEHGQRIKCVVVHVAKGFRGPQVTLSRSHPSLVKKLFALEVPEIADGAVEIAAIAREAGSPDQDRGTVHGHRRERQGRLHRADGVAGPGGHERAARREDRHHRLVRRPGDASSATPCRRPRRCGSRWSMPPPVPPGSPCPTSSSPWPSAGRGRTPGWRPG